MPHTVNVLLPALEEMTRSATQCADQVSEGGVMVMDAEHPCRPRAEALIRDVYKARYAADIRSWMPFLAARRDHQGMQAAAGFRPATERLYLEHYLDRPVDEAIASHIGRIPRRGSIVEVGHLASHRGGAGALLLLDLADHLHRNGFDWLVNTATADTRRLILGLRAAPLALAAADPTRLPDAGAAWGSYYAHEPVVLAIHLPTALGRRKRNRPSLA
ncbi:MAG: thermostable hemolysin [Burkholderiales bacterium]